MATTIENPKSSPPSLVAIAIAARQSRDREMERSALRELRESHGINLSFCRQSRKGVPK